MNIFYGMSPRRIASIVTSGNLVEQTKYPARDAIEAEIWLKDNHLISAIITFKNNRKFEWVLMVDGWKFLNEHI